MVRTSPSRSVLTNYNIDNFKQWLYEREYSVETVRRELPYVKKYGYILCSGSLEELNNLSRYKLNHVLKALTLLSKYLGVYREFKNRLDVLGIKWYRSNSLDAFLRIFNSNNDVLEWFNMMYPFLRENERLFAKFLLLSGLRVSEGITSFNLCIELNKQNRLSEYYNSQLRLLCHLKYPKLFIRKSKCCYITFIKPKFLREICNSQPVRYSAIRKRLERHSVNLRFNELRDVFGTHLINHGILEVEQNLVCGRIPVDIFIRHYWAPKLKELGYRVFKALDKLLLKISK